MIKPTWRATALALATAALFGGVALDANALGLGRVTVQSALGEPLRAEVDIPEATPDELASLKAAVAGPDAFRAAGLEYSPALSGIEVKLLRRPNGRSYLLLTSNRPVNDPFIDLILETQWASGRIVRDYTMLFDPPQMRQGSATAAAPMAPIAPAAPPVQAGRPAQAPQMAQAAQGPRPAAPSQAARPAPTRPAASPAARVAPTPQEPTRAPAAAETPTAQAEKITVQPGDSAGRIAAAHKPPTVSLDQMLIALLQANPQAFIEGNVNRLKSGAVLQMPSAEEAAQTTEAEARRTIVAQSRDFNEFRRRLAEGVPTTPVAGSQRQASGRIQAEVQDKTLAPAGPDKLTLSKGAVQGKNTEDRIAKQREAQDTATRLAELNKNIAELNGLQGSTTGSSPAASGASSPAGPAVTAAPLAAVAGKASASAPAAAAVPTAAALAASQPAAVSAASAPVQAAAASPAPAASASSSTAAAAPVAKPASTPAKPAATAARKPAAPMLIEEPSLLDDLLENPLALAAGGGILALLAGLGAYKLRQRKKSPQVDSSFLESRLQPDSFFGGSGGQRIDTAEGGVTGSSMVYSPSQLDAAGDVDPVAEADVYLAYGRDLQAEEILKEALRLAPHRVGIHAKLLEIYAKRRDMKAFEVAATDAYGLTRGQGPEWERICELGRELDPTNPLYRAGGAPAAGVAAAAAAASDSELQAPATTSPDLDLDLDFSSGEEGASSPTAQSAHLHEAPPLEHDHVELDFDAQPQPAPALRNAAEAKTGAVAAATPASSEDEPLSFELPTIEELQGQAAAPAESSALPQVEENALSFELEPEPEPSIAAGAAAPSANDDDKMLEFDLGSLSLDLDRPAPATQGGSELANPSGAAADDAQSTQGLEEASVDPLATKFALAQEFNAIGDPDGARSLAEEVIAEASGDLKTRAQKFLAEIG